MDGQVGRLLADMAGEQGPPPALAEQLPAHVLEGIFALLSPQDLAVCCRVCTAWLSAAEQDTLWSVMRRRDFPLADGATLGVLHSKAQHMLLQQQSDAASSGQQGRRRRSGEKLVYCWLAERATCERCGQAFTDGGNTPSSCRFHPGILFSGGQLNGAGLRFTCCNRRAHHIPNGSRDGNGCATAFHCGGASAWQRHGSGVKARELQPGPSSSSNSSGSSGSPSSSPPRPYPWVNAAKELQEWHPNQRPGLLELPSRLLFSGNGA